MDEDTLQDFQQFCAVRHYDFSVTKHKLAKIKHQIAISKKDENKKQHTEQLIEERHVLLQEMSNMRALKKRNCQLFVSTYYANVNGQFSERFRSYEAALAVASLQPRDNEQT